MPSLFKIGTYISTLYIYDNKNKNLYKIPDKRIKRYINGNIIKHALNKHAFSVYINKNTYHIPVIGTYISIYQSSSYTTKGRLAIAGKLLGLGGPIVLSLLALSIISGTSSNTLLVLTAMLY